MPIGDAFQLVDKALKASYALATAEQKELLADARNILADLKNESAELKNKKLVLEQKLKQRSNLLPEQGHEWLVLEDDPDPSRRYCQVCYYDRDKVIPLNAPSSGEYYYGDRYCPVCNHYRA